MGSLFDATLGRRAVLVVSSRGLQGLARKSGSSRGRAAWHVDADRGASLALDPLSCSVARFHSLGYVVLRDVKDYDLQDKSEEGGLEDGEESVGALSLAEASVASTSPSEIGCEIEDLIEVCRSPHVLEGRQGEGALAHLHRRVVISDALLTDYWLASMLPVHPFFNDASQLHGGRHYRALLCAEHLRLRVYASGEVAEGEGCNAALRAVLSAPPGVLPYALRVDDAWDDLVSGGGGACRAGPKASKEEASAVATRGMEPAVVEDDDDFFNLV